VWKLVTQEQKLKEEQKFKRNEKLKGEGRRKVRRRKSEECAAGGTGVLLP